MLQRIAANVLGAVEHVLTDTVSIASGLVHFVAGLVADLNASSTSQNS